MAFAVVLHLPIVKFGLLPSFIDDPAIGAYRGLELLATAGCETLQRTLAALAASGRTVTEVMTREVVTVPPDLSVLEALRGKTIIVGVIDLSDESPVEDVETVAERIRAALKHVDPEHLILAPDCGMKYLPREVAFGKMKAMVEGAKLMRRECAGHASVNNQ